MTKQRIPRRRASALGLVLLVALAFAAIGASAAQALDWQHPKATVLSGSETVAGTGAGFTISGTILGSPVKISCGSAPTSGSVVGGGTGTSNIGLSGCAVTEPSKCIVNSPSLNAKTELVQVGSVLFQKFVQSGGPFGEFTFTGSGCEFAGATVPLGGSFAGRELSSALAVNHSLSFSKVEGWPSVELKLGKKVATMSGEVTQHLSGTQAYQAWRSIWQSTHGDWEVESGSPYTSSESVSVSGGPVSFSFSKGGSPISINCSTASASGATIKPGGTETMSGATFSGCNVEPSTCSLPGGKVVFGSITGTLMRVNGNVYERFAPTTAGGAFTAIHFEGPSCPLVGTTYEVEGSFAGLGPQFPLPTVTQPLEISKAANEATGSGMYIGGNKLAVMTMTGSINQKVLFAVPWGAF